MSPHLTLLVTNHAMQHCSKHQFLTVYAHISTKHHTEGTAKSPLGKIWRRQTS